MIRIATGKELKRERTFIRRDGTETTPDEYFAKFKKGPHLGAGGYNPASARGETTKGTKKDS